MTYARHIKAGRLTRYAADANAKLDRAIKTGRACAACGRDFTEKRKPAATDHALCNECKEAL